MSNIKKIIIWIFILFPFIINAQPSLEYKRLEAIYPEEYVIVTKNKDQLNIRIENGRLVLNTDSYVERMYMNNKAGMYSEGSVDYSDFMKLLNIEAGTMVPGNNKYKNVLVKNFVKSDKISNQVFYDGSKNISFLFPSLQQGAKSFLKISKEITEPRLIPPNFFQENIPVISSEYTIVAPNNVKMAWRLFNIKDSSITFSKVSTKDITTYSWKMQNIRRINHEPNAPGVRYYTPHIISWIESYKIDGKEYKILESTRDLYNWYYSLTKEVNKEHSPELKALVDSLVQGETKEIDKVKKIYYWVQENIKYIAVEDGMGGFIPRSAMKVCEKRYGDCKDMASIIFKMLSYAGVTAHLTWIGSNDLPYSYSEIPTPSVDNHMISTYINNGNYYFLDATGPKTPFDIPTSFIQGKEALIGIDSLHYEIKKVPEISAERNQVIDSVKIIIEKNKILGSGSSTFSGYEHISIYQKLQDDKEEPAEILREYYKKGSNKFLINTVETSHVDVRDVPAKIKYTFTIEDYVRSNEEEIFLNLNLDRELQNQSILADRELAVEKPHKDIRSSFVSLVIPAGYKVEFLPSDISYKKERFGFEIKYSSSGGQITQTKKIYGNTLMLKKADFKEWNEMINELNKAYLEVVLLKKMKK